MSQRKVATILYRIEYLGYPHKPLRRITWFSSFENYEIKSCVMKLNVGAKMYKWENLYACGTLSSKEVSVYMRRENEKVRV